jgi:hypothetical protein
MQQSEFLKKIGRKKGGMIAAPESVLKHELERLE